MDYIGKELVIEKDELLEIIEADADLAMWVAKIEDGTVCKRCGKCCEVINIDKRMTDNSSLREKDGYKFLIKYFIEIGIEEAIKKNSRYGKIKNPQTARYFKCSCLVDGVCDNYNNRPELCKVYPVQHGTVMKFIREFNVDRAFIGSCGFVEHLGLIKQRLKELGISDLEEESLVKNKIETLD